MKKISIYNLLFLILLVLIAIFSTSFLNKFPKEDMLWNELALLNSVRWFQDDWKLLDIFSTHDFRMSLGENVFFDLKSMPFFFSIANFLNFQDIGLSIVIEKIILVIVFMWGLYKLLGAQKKEIGPAFFIMSTSIILMPLLNGEIGLLNQEYILLTPILIYYINVFADKQTTKNLLLLVVSVLLFIGKSDVFAFFNILSILIYSYAINKNKNNKIYIYIFIIIYIFVILAYANQILNIIYPDKYIITTRGSVDINVILDTFIYPVWKTIIIPTFVGPASFYLSPLFLSFLALLCIRRDRDFKILVSILLILAIQFIFIVILHTILVNKTPSAVRYNVMLPFVLMGILFSGVKSPENMIERIICIASLSVTFLGIFYFSEYKDSIYRPYTSYLNEYGLNFYDFINIKLLNPIFIFSSLSLIAIFFIFFNNINYKINFILPLILVLIFIVNKGLILHYVDSGKFALQDSGYSKWLTEGAFECINSKIDKLNGSEIYPRSFVSVAPKASNDYPYGQHDIAMTILEQPDKLKGRTFGQWRYNGSKTLASMNEKYTGRGVTSWPLLNDNSSAIVDYMVFTQSPYVLSYEDELSNDNLELLGVCSYSSVKTNFFKLINKTFVPIVYLYKIKNLDINFSKIEYKSKSAIFLPNLNSNIGLTEYKVPIAFHPNLIAIQNGSYLKIKESNDGLSIILGEATSHITIGSFSLNRVFIFIYILVLFTLSIFINRNKNNQ